MTNQHRTLLILAAFSGVAFSQEVTADANGFLSASTTTTTIPPMKYYNGLVDSLPAQHGKVVAITGTTSGLGYWAAMATAKKGPACLIMFNRPSSRAVKAEEDVKKQAGAGVVVVTVALDLQNISSVREAAANANLIAAKFGGLDVLALNAGIMAQPDKRTGDGFDVTMQTNHLSHFLLTKLLMPSLQSAATKRGEVRIITQSSIARKGPAVNATYYIKSPAGTLGGEADNGMERYHQTKLANIAFSMALHSKFAKSQTYSNFKSLSVAPGVAATELHFPSVSIPKWLMEAIKNHILLSAPDGSCSLLTGMYAESVKSGDFYEPEWLVNGGPEQVISEGKPNYWPEVTRKLAGLKDALYCSDEYEDAVWSASEAGLGEKFIIGGEAALVV